MSMFTKCQARQANQRLGAIELIVRMPGMIQRTDTLTQPLQG
jgi:hypothetical protein